MIITRLVFVIEGPRETEFGVGGWVAGYVDGKNGSHPIYKKREKERERKKNGVNVVALFKKECLLGGHIIKKKV